MQPSELKAYWDKVAAEAGIDADAITKVGALFDNEDTSKQFLDKFVPKPEYSRAVDAEKSLVVTAKTALNEATAKITEFDRWAKETAVPYAERMEKRAKLAQSQVDAYVKLYGAIDKSSLPTSATTPEPSPNGGNGDPNISAEQVQAALGMSANNTLNLTTDLMILAESHRDRYGKALDIAGFKSFAEQKFGEATQANRAITLGDAYGEFTLEASTELGKKERKAEIDNAVEKALDVQKQEFSQTHIPMEGAPSDDDMRVYIDPDLAPKEEDKLSEADRMRGFIETFNEEGAKEAAE